MPSGIIKPLDYQLTTDYLSGAARSGLVGAALDYGPTWPSSYETSLLHDSLLAQRLVDRKARLIPGVPTNYQAAEYAARYAAPRQQTAGRRAAPDFVAQSIDINCTLASINQSAR